MKRLAFLALIIAIISLAMSYTSSNQIKKLQSEQKQISDDLLKLKQEIAKTWQSAEKSGSAKPVWPKYYDATGVLKSMSENRIVIDEDEIPGFMKAMIMSYEVENPEQLKGLKEGDKVKFKLKETENDLTVLEIQKQ